MIKLIKLSHISKYYRRHQGNEVIALNDVSLILPNKGLVLIYGPSGCGKTTLLNVLAKYEVYDEGEIINNSQKAAFIFQDYQLIDDLNVYENLRLVLNLQNIKEESKINEVLQKVNLIQYKLHKPNELSGGQKQRVAIARALLLNNATILADEPTGNLDKESSIEIANLLFELSQNKLVIIASHDIDLFNSLATQTIQLEDGKVIKQEIKTILGETPIYEKADDVKYHLNIKAATQFAFKGFQKSKTKLIFSYITLILSLILILLSCNVIFNDNQKTSYQYLKHYQIENVDFLKYDKTIQETIKYQSIPLKEIEDISRKYSIQSYQFSISNFPFYLQDQLFPYINKIYTDSNLKENEIVISDYVAKEINAPLEKFLTLNEVNLKITKIIQTNYQNKSKDELYDNYLQNHCKMVWIHPQTLKKIQQNFLPSFKQFVSIENENYLMMFNGQSSLQKEEIILSKSLFEQMYSGIDENQIVNQKIKIHYSIHNPITGKNEESKEYKIIGVSKDNYTYFSLTDYEYLQLNYNEERYDFYAYNGFSLKQPTKNQLKELHQLGYRHHTYISENYYGSISSLKTFSTLFIIIGSIIFVLNVFLLLNYLNVSLDNKKREIGVLKSMYISTKEISKIFLVEILTISLISFIISSLIEIILLQLFNKILIQTQIVQIHFIYYNFALNFVIILIFIFLTLIYMNLCLNKLKKKSTIDLIYNR